MSSDDTQTADNRYRFLAEAAAWRYRAQGLAVYWMVRQNLLRSRFYRELLVAKRLPLDGALLDIGCGRGVLLALLACMRGLGLTEGAKRENKLRLVGLEMCPEKAEFARLALPGAAEIIVGDAREATLPPCRTAILKDVLLYLDPEEQDKLLERTVSSLEKGGLIIMQTFDAKDFGCRAILGLARWAFGLTLGGIKKPLNLRSGQEWKRRLESLGLHVETVPLRTGTGFCKEILLARKTA